MKCQPETEIYGQNDKVHKRCFGLKNYYLELPHFMYVSNKLQTNSWCVAVVDFIYSSLSIFTFRYHTHLTVKQIQSLSHSQMHPSTIAQLVAKVLLTQKFNLPKAGPQSHRFTVTKVEHYPQSKRRDRTVDSLQNIIENCNTVVLSYCHAIFLPCCHDVVNLILDS